MSRFIPAALALALFLLAAPARGEAEFGFGIGYSQVRIDGAGGPFDKQDGLRMEARITTAPIPDLHPLRIGFGLAFSGYWHDIPDRYGYDYIGGGYYVYNPDLTQSLTLIEPELQVSWRQPLGERFYIEPGVAGGMAIANQWFGDDWSWDTYESEWDSTWTVRPFVRAAFTDGPWRVGIEGSYMWGGNIDVGEFTQGDLSEWYVGAFFALAW